MITTRRSLITGLAGILAVGCAPSIVRASNLMRVKAPFISRPCIFVTTSGLDERGNYSVQTVPQYDYEPPEVSDGWCVEAISYSAERAIWWHGHCFPEGMSASLKRAIGRPGVVRVRSTIRLAPRSYPAVTSENERN